MNIPVELLDLCRDAEWTHHRPTLLTTNPSTKTSTINQLYSVSAFFEIPADKPLYLLSQGNFSYGTVEFLPATYQSPVSQDANWRENGQEGIKGHQEQKIRVEIDAKYRDPSVFDWARVCTIGNDDMEDGTQGGGEPTKDPVLSQVGIMIWVSSITSLPSSSLLINFRFADARD